MVVTAITLETAADLLSAVKQLREPGLSTEIGDYPRSAPPVPKPPAGLHLMMGQNPVFIFCLFAEDVLPQ